MTVRGALLTAVAALLLAACGGGSPLTVGNMSSEPQTGEPKGAAYPSSEKPASIAESNPFALPSGQPSGGREVIPNPSRAEVMQTGPVAEMSWGRADAPVTLIKYASLTCPYCKLFHATVFPELKRTYIDTGKVRFIIREFPIGKTSGNATIALRCAPPEKYLDLYGRFLSQQASWVSQEVRLDPIYAVAKQVGLSRERFDSCLKDEKLIDGLKWVKDRGRTLGVIGTPNFFLQNKLVKKVLTWPELRDTIEAELASPVAAAGTGKS